MASPHSASFHSRRDLIPRFNAMLQQWWRLVLDRMSQERRVYGLVVKGEVRQKWARLYGLANGLVGKLVHRGCTG